MKKISSYALGILLLAFPLLTFAHGSSEEHILENIWSWPPTVRQLHFWGEVVSGVAILLIGIIYIHGKIKKKW